MDVLSHGVTLSINPDGTATFTVESPIGSSHSFFTLTAADWTAFKALTSGQTKTVLYGENQMAHSPREGIR